MPCFGATLGRAGVGGTRPSRAELAADQIGRNDAADRFMVAVARLAFDLAPPDRKRRHNGPRFSRSGRGVGSSSVEKAVLGFARAEFEPRDGPFVAAYRWNGSSHTPQRDSPRSSRMVTDIVLERRATTDA